MNDGASGHLDDTTRAVWTLVMFFSVLLRLKIGHLSAALFKPETQSVLWTHTLHPPFHGTGVSR